MQWVTADGANFSKSALNIANFSFARLMNASFRGARVTDASFAHAHVAGSDFSTSIGWEKVHFEGAWGWGVKLPPGHTAEWPPVPPPTPSPPPPPPPRWCSSWCPPRRLAYRRKGNAKQKKHLR